MLTKKIQYNPEDQLIGQQIDSKTHALSYQSYNQRRAQQQPTKDKKENTSMTYRKDIETNQDEYKKQYDSQSRKILELQNYKTLCENYIEKMSPNQKLPLCQNDLKNIPQNQQHHYPSIETSEELMKLQSEKESLISTLQKETVLNEQQRNYIEILKQTIESSILKNGLGNKLQLSKGFQNQSTLDAIIDVSRTQNEIEKSRKDYAMAQMLINELKVELDSNKKSYEDLTVLSNILKDKLEREKINNTELSKQCSSQEQAVLSLEETIKNSNDQIKTLKISLSDYQSLCSKYEKEIFENGRKLNEMNNTLSSYQVLQKKYNENKDLYNRLDFEHQRQSKDKNDLEIFNHKLKEELDKLKEEKKVLNDEMVQKEEIFQKEKKTLLEEKEGIRRTLTKSQNKNIDISNIVQQKDKEIHERQEQHINLEKQLQSYQAHIKDLEENFNSFKSKAETTAQIDTEKIIQYTNKISELNKQISNLESDCESYNTEAYKLKDSNRKCQIEIEQLLNEKDKTDSLSKNLSAQYETLLASYRQLEIDSNRLRVDNDGVKKESLYWKEKYNKDSTEKGSEIISLSNQIKKLTYQNDEYLKTNDRLKFDLNLKREEKDQCDMNNNKFHSEVISLKNENDVLQRTMIERNKVIRNEEQSTYELTGQLNSCLSQIKELVNENTQLKSSLSKLEADLIENNSINNSLKKTNGFNDQKLNSFTQSLNSHCKSINQCIDLLSQYANRFASKVKSDNVSMPFYSREFFEYINDIILSQQKLNAFSPIDKLNEIEVFLSHLIIENFNWFNYIKELNASINDYSQKASLLQLEVERYEVALKEKGNDLIIQDEKIKEMVNTTDSIKRSNDTLVSHLSSQQNVMTSASYELNSIKNENNKLIALTNRLNEESDQKNKLLSNATYQVDALEERIVMLSKEKKYYEDIIEKLSQNSVNKEAMRTVNNLLTICDHISQLERQKKNAENKGRNDGVFERQLQNMINEYNMLCDSIEISGRSPSGSMFNANDRLMTYEFKNNHNFNSNGNKGNMFQEYNRVHSMNNTNCNSMRLDDTLEQLSTVPNININSSVNSSTTNKPARFNNAFKNKFQI